MHPAASGLGSLYETGEFGLGSNMAFRTAALREAGGFDLALGTGTQARAGEDLAMLIELLASGRRIGYEPDAIIQHSHRATMEELERQIRGYGVGLTAMLTAITLRDPRHALGLAAIVPRWLRSLGDAASAKQVHRAEDYPAALARAELRGMIAGPAATCAPGDSSGGGRNEPGPARPAPAPRPTWARVHWRPARPGTDGRLARPLRLRKSLTVNAMSLMTATIATNALGLVFWAVAAHLEPPAGRSGGPRPPSRR